MPMTLYSKPNCAQMARTSLIKLLLDLVTSHHPVAVTLEIVVLTETATPAVTSKHDCRYPKCAHTTA